MKIGNFTTNVLHQYSRSYPSAQNAINIFEKEWISVMPDVEGKAVSSGGKINLFDDERIKWANKQIGGFEGMNILELGPLEGGHSYMLQTLGANSVLAIEANARSYSKCLITKELYCLDRCRFVLGDFVEYLKHSPQKFDYCLASGVLYHMQNPIELISLIAKASRSALIWTQYYDELLMAKSKPYFRRQHFSRGEKCSEEGFNYIRYKQWYGRGLTSLTFAGGTLGFSYWLRAEDILAALKHFGFRNISISFHETDRPSGPSFCLACAKD